ncbi:LacI family DNA-binding transcriptional regulator [Sphingobium sp. Leaf26]|uniref:LacI family DNA-binding transcriptional regulator n=1 Tax=Sphingobium sp. Leaf26 TaxID=1735693 RepID=UPI0009E85CB6|nr:LacI family DNA-binding transcriptional regulator [Sphingobium sp. Leaf26]
MSKKRDQSNSVVTIRGVAKHMGVSWMNVSNVTNGRRVTPAVREAVERSLADLNYVLNPAGRPLSRGSYISISILYGPIEHPLASTMMIGASTPAARLGRHLPPQSAGDRLRLHTVCGLLMQSSFGITTEGLPPPQQGATSCRTQSLKRDNPATGNHNTP